MQVTNGSVWKFTCKIISFKRNAGIYASCIAGFQPAVSPESMPAVSLASSRLYRRHPAGFFICIFFPVALETISLYPAPGINH